MEATEFRHPITVEEFDRMDAAGVFGDLRIELVDGQLIDVPPQDPPHAGTISYCSDRFREAFGTKVMVRAQMPFRVGDRSQPEPDIALVRPDSRWYRDRHACTDDVIAVVEVADSSLSFDRGVKRKVYGGGGVPEYWIIDLRNETIETFREPHDLGYARHETHRRGQSVSFAAFPDVVFSVDELLG